MSAATNDDDPLNPVYETELQLPTYALSTAIYAERDDGSIILLQRAEGTAMAGFYFLPGGLVDEGEEPFAAAARELREETGLEFAEAPQMVGCYPMWIYGRDMLQLSFRGRVAGEANLSHEHTAHRWVAPADFGALFSEEAVTTMANGDERIASILGHIGVDVQRYLSLVARA